MASENQSVCELRRKSGMENIEDCRPYQGPMAVITRGGNELMNSYNSVTQNLLNEVNCLEERLQEKNCELYELKRENERLLARVHELLVGAELREEAMESKSPNKKGNVETGVIHLTMASDMDGKYFSNDSTPTTPWFKLTVLLGFTICVSVAIRSGLDL